MKKKAVISLFLAVLLLASIAVPAAAQEWSDFTDVSGHWAEETLKKGFENGAITGVSETALCPDEPITTAQMLTIICRVLSAREPAGAPVMSIPADAWYASDAAKACALGLISGTETDLDTPMLRQDALALLAKAFCLVPASPDLSAVSSMSDYSALRAENRGAAAALVSAGYVSGYNGSLSADSGITRAEFLSVLYRIADSSADSGSAVLDSGALSGSYTQNIWLDCTVDSVSLTGVNAKSITALSPALSGVSLSGAAVDTLVLKSCGALEVPDDSRVGTLRLGGSASAKLGENVGSLELTGSGADITLSGAHTSLAISGNSNTVLLSAGCSLDSITISGDNNILRFAAGSGAKAINVTGACNTLEPVSADAAEDEEKASGENSFSSVSLSGSKNSVTLLGAAFGAVSLSGTSNVLLVTADGAVSSAAVSGGYNWLTLTCTDIGSISEEGSCNSIHKFSAGAVGTISSAGTGSGLRLYEGNTAQTVSLAGSGSSLTVDGTAQSVTVDGRNVTVSGAGSAGTITVNSFGCTVSLAAQQVNNANSAERVADVLSRVSSSYTGSFTLKWAQEHDYTEGDKEIFVNAKGYSSSTGYLIWVNKAMQRVNIFEGSSGSWTLIHSCIVGTGAMSSQTPVGVYNITYKLEAGWTTGSYTCRPVVGFKAGSGYAFHSRLYYPRTNNLKDAQIGYPVSHGCVRMYDEDVRYIYDNMPIGTTVVVF